MNTIQKILVHLQDPFHSPVIRRWTMGWCQRTVRSYCPICRTASNSPFADYYANFPVNPYKLENYFCPKCWSMPRHRFHWLYLQNALDEIDEGLGNLLHFAPEHCLEPHFSKLFGENYLTGDIDPGHAKKVIDITDICLSDESYNFIICNHVLEHIPDDRKALSEMYRVLKRNGTAFLSVPIKEGITDEDLTVISSAERSMRFGQADHVRFYGMDFKNRIEEAGFSVSVIRVNTIIPFKQIRELFGIEHIYNNEDLLFVAKK